LQTGENPTVDNKLDLQNLKDNSHGYYIKYIDQHKTELIFFSKIKSKTSEDELKDQKALNSILQNIKKNIYFDFQK
jgi:hypothetical protein